MSNRPITVYLPLLIIAMVLALVPSAPSSAQSQGGLGAGPETGVIIYTAKPYANLVDAIQVLGGTVTFQYQNADAIAARIPSGSLGRLTALPAVVRIEKDRTVQLPPAPGENLGVRALPVGRHQVLHPGVIAGRVGEVPEGVNSYLTTLTGAADTWADTGAGASSIVAVIDTGTEAGHPCLSGRGDAGHPASRVIAGPDLSPDAGTRFEGSTAPTNNYHGTFVAGVIASRCFIVLDKRVPSDRDLAEIFEAHLPPDAFFTTGQLILVPLVGIAPASTIYAVKVFPHTGSGVATSIIEAALDHVISRKKQFLGGRGGGLDIAVVNMSLGGASLYDGGTLEEQLVDAATKAGMVVVAAAGNDGPAPVSISSPGTAFTALTVGAASDPVHTRIVWDIVFGPGQGLALYPGDELRPADFSGRGPLGDGRTSPDVIATGVFNLSLLPEGLTGFGSGTSFSTPVVAGGAALLSAWAKAKNPSVGPLAIRNAIMDGAAHLPERWQRRSQGSGYLDVARALTLLKSGSVVNELRPPAPDEALPNVSLLGGLFTAKVRDLRPGQTADFVIEVTPDTSTITVQLTKVAIDPNPVPAVIPNSIELYVKGAKRGGTSYIVYSANVFGSASVTIGDGFVDLAGLVLPFYVDASPMEPGLMKVTVQGDWTNNGNVGATISIQRSDDKRRVAAGPRILSGGTVLIPVDVPPGTTEAVFELGWEHNWERFPTNDLDLFLCAPGYVLFPDASGATLNSPERIVVANPAAGNWHVMVMGFGVFTRDDAYYLDVDLTVPAGNPPGRPGAHGAITSRLGNLHNPSGHNESVFKGEPCF